eukprot:GHVU01181996.1.p1 GENE.GHVU01181996.1~~GHVU01181996.1.p1  ORF type:complete len:180 (-),score=31.94 GHVU01181996.1:159-698(-)
MQQMYRETFKYERLTAQFPAKYPRGKMHPVSEEQAKQEAAAGIETGSLLNKRPGIGVAETTEAAVEEATLVQKKEGAQEEEERMASDVPPRFRQMGPNLRNREDVFRACRAAPTTSNASTFSNPDNLGPQGWFPGKYRQEGWGAEMDRRSQMVPDRKIGNWDPYAGKTHLKANYFNSLR